MEPRPAWLRILKLATTVVIVFAILFTAGNAIPDWLVTDGLERFTEEEWPAAANALFQARRAYHEPGERLFYRWRWMQVVDVELRPGYCRDVRAWMSGSAIRDHRAVVQIHTFFAIPAIRLLVECESYRILRGR